MNNQKVFLKGFNEMKKRIEPPLIIVYGDMISGMTRRFVNIKYKDAFNNKNKEFKQLCLWKESNIIERKDVLQYGK